jgi:hypothetical protein
LPTDFSPESHVAEKRNNKLKGEFESQKREKEDPGEDGKSEQ